MNPIILTLISIYLVVVLSKNVFPRNDVKSSLAPPIAATVIFIRTHMDDIFITVLVLLGLIVYFTMAGVNLNPKSHVTIEKEVTMEKFDNIDSVDDIHDVRKHISASKASKSRQTNTERESVCSGYSDMESCTTHGQEGCGWVSGSSSDKDRCTRASGMTEKGVNPTLTTPNAMGYTKIQVGSNFPTCGKPGGCITSGEAMHRWGTLSAAGPG